MGKINFLVDVWVRAWAFYWTMAATLDLREACGSFHMGFLNLSTLIKMPGKLGSHLKYGPVPLPKSGWPRKYSLFIHWKSTHLGALIICSESITFAICYCLEANHRSLRHPREIFIHLWTLRGGLRSLGVTLGSIHHNFELNSHCSRGGL